MSTFWRIALGCQLPVRSGCPSAARGAGPGGGQLGAPPRPCAEAAPGVSNMAATAAAARVMCRNVPCMQGRLSLETANGHGNPGAAADRLLNGQVQQPRRVLFHHHVQLTVADALAPE